MFTLIRLILITVCAGTVSVVMAYGKPPQAGSVPSANPKSQGQPLSSKAQQGIGRAQKQAVPGIQRGMQGLQDSQASPQGKQKGLEGMKQGQQQFLDHTEKAKSFQKSN